MKDYEQEFIAVIKFMKFVSAKDEEQAVIEGKKLAKNALLTTLYKIGGKVLLPERVTTVEFGSEYKEEEL